MSDHYDDLETRDPERREADLFSRLPAVLAKAKDLAPGWTSHLDGVDPAAITSREALAALPVFRKQNLLTLQRENPPFGGLNLVKVMEATGDLAGAQARLDGVLGVFRDAGDLRGLGMALWVRNQKRRSAPV